MRDSKKRKLIETSKESLWNGRVAYADISSLSSSSHACSFVSSIQEDLSLRKWSLALHSPSPRSHLRDLLNPLLFDKPAAFRFTTYWMLLSLPFTFPFTCTDTLSIAHRLNSEVLLKLFLVEKHLLDPENDSVSYSFIYLHHLLRLASF